MKKVYTVLGPIHPDELGLTAMHEHIFWGPPGWEYDPHWWFSKTAAYEKAHKDLSDFRILGGNTFVDLSGLGLGRDLPAYIELAKSSGLNIVACTGFWAERGIAPFFLDKDADYFEQLFLKEIQQGMGDTDVKAGIIKAGNDKTPMSKLEDTIYRAAARTSKKTGIAIATHGILHAREQVDIMIDQEGVDPGRVVISHCDAGYSIDLDRDKYIAKKGAYVAYDHIGIEEWSPMPYAMNDDKRVELVLEMLNAGYEDQLLLSCDVNSWSLGWSMAPLPLHNVGHLLRYFVPKLQEAGVGDETIRHLLVENPRKILPY